MNIVGERVLCWCNQCRGRTQKNRRTILRHMREAGRYAGAPSHSYVPVEIEPDFDLMETADFPSLDQQNLSPNDVNPAEAANVCRQNADQDTQANIPPQNVAENNDEENESPEETGGVYEMLVDWFSRDSSFPNPTPTQQQEKIHEGSTVSLFAASVALLDLKVAISVSNRNMNLILRVIRCLIPQPNLLPKTCTELKSIVNMSGLKYEKIHACRNDCVLFRGELQQSRQCPTCDEPRYLPDTNTATKVFRKFSVSQSLQQEFESAQRAALQTWHSKNQSTDGFLRSAIDGSTWKDFAEKFPEFNAEARNLHLAVFGDGVSPFRSTAARPYSCWPIGLINLNIPPHLSVKTEHILLGGIIPGPKQVRCPDTYLEPLVEEFQQLWTEGIECEDSSKPLEDPTRIFTLKAAIMYTTTDFPGLRLLSGLATSGKYACPSCAHQFPGRYAKHLNTTVYSGHRIFLPEFHSLRQENIELFDGRIESRPCPVQVTALDWYHAATSTETQILPEGMNRLSVFYRLPYFRLPHKKFLLDFMHIVKNVSATLYKFLMGQRDTTAVRLDLEEYNSKPEAWIRNGRQPAAAWVLKQTEQAELLEDMKKIKVPSAYGAAPIRNCIAKTNESVRDAINEVSSLVKWLSNKKILASEIPGRKIQAALAVCKVEASFPTAALTTQMHNLVHLVDEVEAWGPAGVRSMFAVERYLKLLKSMVFQKVHPEATISEKWIDRVNMVFCSEYLQRTALDAPLLWQMKENVPTRFTGRPRPLNISQNEKINIGNFVLHNEPELVPYLERFQKEREVNAELPLLCNVDWLESAVEHDLANGFEVSEFVKDLSRGCSTMALSYTGMWCNGFHFRVERSDRNKKTQDCVVRAPFHTCCIAGRGDRQPQYELMLHTGKLQEIYEVRFGTFKRTLFKVTWFRLQLAGNQRQRTWKTMENGIEAIRTQIINRSDDVFVYPEFCRQAFTHRVPNNSAWSYVVDIIPRNWKDYADEDDGSSEEED